MSVIEAPVPIRLADLLRAIERLSPLGTQGRRNPCKP